MIQIRPVRLDSVTDVSVGAFPYGSTVFNKVGLKDIEVVDILPIYNASLAAAATRYAQKKQGVKIFIPHPKGGKLFENRVEHTIDTNSSSFAPIERPIPRNLSLAQALYASQFESALKENLINVDNFLYNVTALKQDTIFNKSLFFTPSRGSKSALKHFGALNVEKFFIAVGNIITNAIEDALSDYGYQISALAYNQMLGERIDYDNPTHQYGFYQRKSGSPTGKEAFSIGDSSLGPESNINIRTGAMVDALRSSYYFPKFPPRKGRTLIYYKVGWPKSYRIPSAISGAVLAARVNRLSSPIVEPPVTNEPPKTGTFEESIAPPQYYVPLILLGTEKMVGRNVLRSSLLEIAPAYLKKLKATIPSKISFFDRKRQTLLDRIPVLRGNARLRGGPAFKYYKELLPKNR